MDVILSTMTWLVNIVLITVVIISNAWIVSFPIILWKRANILMCRYPFSASCRWLGARDCHSPESRDSCFCLIWLIYCSTRQHTLDITHNALPSNVTTILRIYSLDRRIFGLVWFILRPCQHDNGYIDGRSQIKVHTDERTQVHSA